MPDTPHDSVTDYAQRVLAGEIPAGYLVRAACQRHLDDLARTDWRFDVAQSERACAFFGILKHFQGEFNGQPFILEPWQRFIIGSLFGWVHPETGLRRFRRSYVEIPRKNGKSPLAAGVGLLMMLVDGENGAEVYTAATKEDQAKIVWNFARQMVRKTAGIAKRVRQLHNTLRFEATASLFRPLGADSKTLDGLNPHCAIGDEFHAWPDRELYDVLDSAFGARRHPLFFLITTAGFQQIGPCWEMRNHVEHMLTLADYDDDTLFAYIACPDKDDDPFDEATWWKANPNLAVSKKLDYMRDQARQAQQVPSKKPDFLVKQLNIWTQSATVWLRMDRWDDCAQVDDWAPYAGARCYAGLDFASSTDFAAVAYVFPPTATAPHWAFTADLFLPEAALSDAQRIRDRAILNQLQRWHARGFLHLTPGDWIDYAIIRQKIVERARTWSIAEIGFDPHNAGDTPQHLQDDDRIPCVAVSQGHRTLGAPTKEFERLVLARQWHHDGNPVLRWMASNTVVVPDQFGNHRPDKRKCAEKIDGIVAALIALQRAMVWREKEKTPGVFVLGGD